MISALTGPHERNKRFSKNVSDLLLAKGLNSRTASRLLTYLHSLTCDIEKRALHEQGKIKPLDYVRQGILEGTKQQLHQFYPIKFVWLLFFFFFCSFGSQWVSLFIKCTFRFFYAFVKITNVSKLVTLGVCVAIIKPCSLNKQRSVNFS